MLDGYAEVKIEAVAPGAALEGVVYDQWVTVSRGGARLELFDQDCACPETLAGTTQRVKIGLMLTRIVPSQRDAKSVKDNTFDAKVISNIGDGVNLIEVLGIPMQLITDREQKPNSFLEIRGRLDLLDIEGVESEGWRRIPTTR
ncbi:hypothetical protein H8E65_06590 [Candidatus Bathyarchaeota archaeon]|nr:hypothetical protein [Candidatus Bathyarchaeota archaeon]MBL7080229.1 hypothetical protein [Candidatus Bathyarchaeota archaeon]